MRIMSIRRPIDLRNFEESYLRLGRIGGQSRQDSWGSNPTKVSNGSNVCITGNGRRKSQISVNR